MAAPKKAKGLGKGLDALFGDVEVTPVKSADKKESSKQAKADTAAKKSDETEASQGGVLYIDINDIKPNTGQPRKHFDEEKLEELASSIQQHGLIQPIVLRKLKTGYEIVAGERRWRACRIVGLKEVPCIVKELTDEENMLLAIIENMQREDLNPIEEAEGLKQMIDTYGLTQEQVSYSVGKSRPYITNSLRLLKLPEEVRTLTASGEISVGHAKALAAVKDRDKQITLAKKTAKDGLSVRQIELMAKETKAPARKAPKVKKSADEKKIEEDMKNALGTKVNLNRKGKKGKIEIEFYSDEELERLIELITSLK
ncbi:MAG: ParB/RepB/Spo0J family partition protein [Lentihominibacter sp.]|nr:ParB/RepB/Spo0J family partition protein [Bacillota bacterium]MDY5607144.1 ParB/RepB/Spo0J family partition protein [Lentihominibacter sp.]